jgi:hypothetical protein
MLTLAVSTAMHVSWGMEGSPGYYYQWGCCLVLGFFMMIVSRNHTFGQLHQEKKGTVDFWYSIS